MRIALVFDILSGPVQNESTAVRNRGTRISKDLRLNSITPLNLFGQVETNAEISIVQNEKDIEQMFY